jgi:hypothetical protein
MFDPVEDSTAFRSVVRDCALAMPGSSVQPYEAGLEIFARAGREWPVADGD